MNKRAVLELGKLEADPPTGIIAWPDEEQSQAQGALVVRARTPYALRPPLRCGGPHPTPHFIDVCLFVCGGLEISGPPDTPYDRGMFNLEVNVSTRYVHLHLTYIVLLCLP
jgi:hypothetical protein